ncbi:cytochrome P450 [Massilia sp. B-10]|nr:cytochrome P450 [Massilia sp. B-10]
MRDIDIYALDGAPDEHQRSLKALHPADGARLYWTPRNGGHWVVTRSDLIETRADRPHAFLVAHVTVLSLPQSRSADRPAAARSARERQVPRCSSGAMSARAATSLGTSIAPLAQELAAGLRARGRCEFIGQFARHLPIATFLHMCGLLAPPTASGWWRSPPSSWPRGSLRPRPKATAAWGSI